MSRVKEHEETTTIRIHLSSYDLIRQYAEKEKLTIQDAFDRLLEDFRRKKFYAELEKVNGLLKVY